jgi:hypothetical protein
MATVATQLNSGTGFSSGETVTASKLNNLVNTATVTGIVNTDIDNGADIAGGKLADSAVATAKIADAAVNAAKLEDSAVETAKTVITDPLADTDEFLVHDASASTLRKVAYSSMTQPSRQPRSMTQPSRPPNLTGHRPAPRRSLGAALG